jgi:hypothetical protein
MPGRFPVRRLLMLAWAISACTLTTQQAVAQALPPAVVACVDERDSTQRLACYDREVSRAVAASQRSPAPSPGATARAPTSTSSAQATQPTTAVAPATAATNAPTSLVPAGTGTPATSSAPMPASPPTAAPRASTPVPLSEVDAFGMTPQIQHKENHGTPPPRLDKLVAHITAVSQNPAGEFVVTLDNGQVWEEAEATSHLPLRTGDNITIKRGMLGAFYMSAKQALGLRVKRVR